MGYPLYSLPSDNITSSATITAAAGTTLDTAYPVENLGDLNPAKPAKLDATSGGWVFNFGAPASIELFALIHHNLDAGLEVRLQGHATDAWDAPTLNTLLTIPADAVDGFSVNPWLDLTGAGHSFQYWRLMVVGVNSAKVAIGELIFSQKKRTLPTHLAPNFTDLEEHPLVEHRTDHGVSTVYGLGTRWRSWDGEMPAISDANVTEMQTLTRATRGRARAFLLIPDPAVNEAWMVRLGKSQLSLRRYMVGISHAPFTIQEVSCGLPL